MLIARIKFGIVGHTQLPAGSRGIGVFFCLRFLFARGRRGVPRVISLDADFERG
ncbi:hypothetical protein SC09_Contig17orf00145 [Bacillus subtilis]|uniref:Uncharacterized protein n=1 Tax=Bacillus subtilis TaxID=1423 RepID=A0A0D1KWD5_BACIU|nr:hypothetical protein SC09_Contig17orf00145 [Bacillus subtilis]